MEEEGAGRKGREGRGEIEAPKKRGAGQTWTSDASTGGGLSLKCFSEQTQDLQFPSHCDVKDLSTQVT